MNCHEYELVLMDIARGAPDPDRHAGAALDHAGRCPRCAAMLADQRELSRGLRTLAASVEVPSSTALEARLLAHHGSREAADATVAWYPALKVAAAVVLLAGAVFLAWRDVSDVPPGAAPSPSAGFVLWPGAATLPPFESGELVRTELPVTVLPTLGLPTPETPRETVTADLLVAQDGLVRAVRLAN
jgi:hypothetical protein